MYQLMRMVGGEESFCCLKVELVTQAANSKEKVYSSSHVSALEELCPLWVCNVYAVKQLSSPTQSHVLISVQQAGCMLHASHACLLKQSNYLPLGQNMW